MIWMFIWLAFAACGAWIMSKHDKMMEGFFVALFLGLLGVIITAVWSSRLTREKREEKRDREFNMLREEISQLRGSG